ncbi:MAG: putative rane protein [Nocardioides sp.]|uniref:hypothetical protein n=1 Tax=Nocardioides sp. TaxID=35761 RepID=UPI0026357618|nr:hypothetical protein [Nocardioides sp.]MCW2835589.1 putative rane protein [Nocardioides sp.]
MNATHLATRAAERRHGPESGPGARPRTLASYLALPRTGDIVKWIILPVGFLIGMAARGRPEQVDVLRAVVVWFSLELLVYQARYQWNDIRGFDADQRHPGGDRGRLPGPPERRRSRFAWSAATAAAKIVLACALCWALDVRTGVFMILLTAGVFGLAAVYEALRSVSTGRSDKAPAPITAGIVAIWIVIGAGYALRVVTGLGLAVDLTSSRLLLPMAVLTGWAFGIAWITSRWAVEATAFARLEGRRLRWYARRDQAREHQLALAPWLPDEVPSSVHDLGHWQPVKQRSAWSAPWNVAGVVAAGGAAACGALLAGPGASGGTLVMCVGLGILAGASVLAAGSRREVAIAVVLPIVIGAMALAGVDTPTRACLPWLALSVAQACYLRQDRASLGQFLRRPAPRHKSISRGTTSTPQS